MRPSRLDGRISLRGWRILACALVIAGCATPGYQPVVPNQAAVDNNDGCWVHVFGRRGYRPPVTTYTGPTGERVFAGAAGSIIVGPNARVFTFAPGGDPGGDGVLPPGARVPYFASTDSYGELYRFKLECVSRNINPAIVQWR